MPRVAKLERLTRENRHAQSREAGRPERMEAIRALSNREDTLGTLADHIVSEKEPTEKEHPVRAEKTVTMRQETLMDAFVGFSDLTKDYGSAVITLKDHNRILRAEPD